MILVFICCSFKELKYTVQLVSSIARDCLQELLHAAAAQLRVPVALPSVTARSLLPCTLQLFARGVAKA